MLTTLEMPADSSLADSSVPFIPSPDAAAAADLLDTPTPADSPEVALDDLLGDAIDPPVVGEVVPEKSNGHAATLIAKHNYWLVFPRSIRGELTAAGIEVQGQQKISDTHDRIYCRCTDEVKSAVESRFHADLTWEVPGATSNAAALADMASSMANGIQLEPLCEQPDADDAKTVVVKSVRLFPPFSVLPMPLNADGNGPETEPKKVVRTVYQIWDSTNQTVKEFDTESEAKSEADRMNSVVMVIDPAQPPKPKPRTETTADKLRKSESRVVECSIEIIRCERVIESAKDRMKLLRETMAELVSEVEWLRSGEPIDDDDEDSDSDEDSTPQGTETAEAQTAVISTPPEPAPAAVDSLEWRSIPTLRVCNEPSPIKGLGPGKLATLAEKYPDLGSLEDARTKAGASGLHSVLPNGCGKGLGELLTERIIYWLTKTRDAAAFAELTGASVTGQASEPVSDPQPQPLPAGMTSTVCPAGIAVNDPDATGESNDGRTVEMTAVADVEPAVDATPDAEPPAKKKGRKPKGSGATAQKELPMIAAPASSPTADPALPPGTPSAKEWNALNDSQQREFILARSHALNTGKANCLDPKHPVSQRSWESGYEANGTMADGEELKITDCPYIPGDEFDDWLRGWLAKDAIANYEAKEGGKAAAVKEDPAPQPQPQPPPAAVPSTAADDLFDLL